MKDYLPPPFKLFNVASNNNKKTKQMLILISPWIAILILSRIIITIYLIVVHFTVRSNTTPDCLQFCRPCVAKAASLLHTHQIEFILQSSLTKLHSHIFIKFNAVFIVIFLISQA